jgi:hypothetical protein
MSLYCSGNAVVLLDAVSRSCSEKLINFILTLSTSRSYRLYFLQSPLVLLGITDCTSRGWGFLFFIFCALGFCRFLVLPILSGVLLMSNGCTSRKQVFELPCWWWYYFVFSTFRFCLFSRTSCIKWVYCLFRIVVLIVLKYLNFLAGGGIILFFLHVDFVGFLVLPTLSGCTAYVKWLYFLALFHESVQ